MILKVGQHVNQLNFYFWLFKTIYNMMHNATLMMCVYLISKVTLLWKQQMVGQKLVAYQYPLL